MNDMIDYEKRARVFLNQHSPVHITTTKDLWLNGYLIEVSADFLIIEDRVLGRMPLFYNEIQSLDFFIGDIKSLKKKEKL